MTLQKETPTVLSGEGSIPFIIIRNYFIYLRIFLYSFILLFILLFIISNG